MSAFILGDWHIFITCIIGQCIVLDNILNGYFNLFLNLHCLIVYKIDDICILTYIHNNHDKFLHYF